MPCLLCGEIECGCSGAKPFPSAEGTPSAPEDSWRQEVSARLNRYHARRKPRPPRYPSLRLRFEEENFAGSSAGQDSPSVLPPPTACNQALALDNSIALASPELSSCAAEPQPSPELPLLDSSTAEPPPSPSAKIIEFPRSWTPAAPPSDELAEPVLETPRILEAPEIVAPAPALGGITIEPAAQTGLEKRPGIDVPLQSAPLSRRILAAAADGLLIAVACTLFALIFWKIAAIRPPRFQLMGLAVGLAAALWAAYQYLLIVYSGTTPGLRLARLQLARFDGSPARRRLRRWRVFAAYLSAVSLGMGYAWVFLDEDALCWHDRITHTYLAPRPAPADCQASKQPR